MLQLVGQAKVVHHQPARLVLEYPIHPRDRLHQVVARHLLVRIHRVQARRVEARQPHVAHDHQLERVRRVLEAVRQFAALVLAERLKDFVNRRAGRSDGIELVIFGTIAEVSEFLAG